MHFLKRFAYRFGFQVNRLQVNDRLDSFLNLVRPMKTEHELIRIGGDADGGYLLPDDLNGIVACFSPGVDVTATFEAEMVRRGIKCFQADASIEESPLAGNPMVHFQRKYLGVTNDEQTITLDDWVKERMGDEPGDLILQMDIEGAEWLVIAGTSDETLQRFRTMAIEFHSFTRILDEFGIGIFEAVFSKLRKNFEILHVHPNNFQSFAGHGDHKFPEFIEYTFHRKDRIKSLKPAVSFPHPLDRNNISGSTMPLPEVMYRATN